MNKDLPLGTTNSILRQATAKGKEIMRYAIVIEKAENNYAAYIPDLPGYVAAADTIEETKQLLREAVEIHIKGMKEDGLPIPEPTIQTDYLEIAA